MSSQAPGTDQATSAVNLRVRNDIRALIDQTLVRVDAATYEHFLAVLDQPASGEGFERLMEARKPWQA